MRKLFFSIIISSLVFCGNLEVDGGITATGEVQSPTIQALLDQIAQLQQDIALFQNQLNELNNNNESNGTKSIVKILNAGTYSISDILPDITIDWALITPVKCFHISEEGSCGINDSSYMQESQLEFYNDNYGFEPGFPSSHLIFNSTTDVQLNIWSNGDDDRVKILVVYEEVSNE